MAAKILILGLVVTILDSVLSQRNVTEPVKHCERPANVVPVKLSEFQGLWYFLRTVNYKDKVYDGRCIRGQFGVAPGGWSGAASWVSISKSTNLYRNDLYFIWQSEPGIVDFQGLGDPSVSATYFILKFVPKNRTLISVCYKENGNYLDQIYSYYTYGTPKVNEQLMANDYREAGIRIRNSMTISQFDPDCFKQES